MKGPNPVPSQDSTSKRVARKFAGPGLSGETQNAKNVHEAFIQWQPGGDFDYEFGLPLNGEIQGINDREDGQGGAERLAIPKIGECSCIPNSTPPKKGDPMPGGGW